MKKVFIISKNTSFSNYLFLLINELNPSTFTLAAELTEDLDLMIIDTESINPDELKEYSKGIPIILFAFQLKPLLIQYTSIYDVNGVISLSMEADEILKTLRAALEGDMFYNETIISMLFSNKANDIVNRIKSLTERENEILLLMMKDQSNEEIAESLNLSVRTVNAHKGNVMRKIGSKTTSGLIQTLLEYSAQFRNSL
ncbi:DNA-binding response regulator, NarL/FixJ family, contains REC and HTH domains [Ekhidna lutea]|uniref:DNA-binding response regulator, NarL/FixJ family, contains REC and HTH domains n=1 Tax=Ekhidna lutea TaxID=447679 RepID=A0A239KLI0_EKHLU|nr:LuxR C-terminal-related transcriptional regulator [Ekhidna lutea]SNT18449.1 DNA-binding response regulator, NarL/FixJ family, contains REC and HTH domains [Ekhidna lutea]